MRQGGQGLHSFLFEAHSTVILSMDGLLFLAARTASGAFVAKWLLNKFMRRTVPYTLRKHTIVIPDAAERALDKAAHDIWMLIARSKGQTEMPGSHPYNERIRQVAVRIWAQCRTPHGAPINCFRVGSMVHTLVEPPMTYVLRYRGLATPLLL